MREATLDQMSDVFISYAHATAHQARAAAETLRTLGYTVWLDDDLPAHRAFTQEIEAQLMAAKAALVIWSADAVRSDWVLSEANRAREERKLVQISVDGARLPMPFDQTQCVDLTGWTGDVEAPGWKKVMASVADLVGSAPRRHKDVDQRSAQADWRPGSESSSDTGWRSRWALALAAAVVLIAVVGAGALLWRSQSPMQFARVAVVPFDASGQGGKATNLARSLTEGISDALSANQVALLRSEDSLSLRGPGSSGQIERLGVSLVLDGSVRSDGKMLSVRVHLDDPHSHVTLWSKTYDGSIDDPAVLMARVGGHATNAIGLAVSPGAASIRGNSDLLAAYLEAADQYDGSGRSLAIYRDLIARAPNFSRAHSLLATGLLAQISVPAAEQSGVVAEAVREASRALALDPANADAYFALSLAKPAAAWGEREELLRKGLSQEPGSADLHAAYSGFLRQTGYSREAVSQARQAVSAAPFKERPRRFLALALATAGQADEASATADEARRLWPDNANAFVAQLMVAAFSMPPTLRLVAFRDDPLLRTVAPAALASLMRRSFEATLSTDAVERKAVAAEIYRAAATGDFPGGQAMCALGNLGDVDDAFAFADLVATPERMGRAAWLSPVDTNVLFAPSGAILRRDRRFMPLMTRLGLLDYWRSTNHWPDFCSEAGLPYDCRAEAARLAAKPSS